MAVTSRSPLLVSIVISFLQLNFILIIATKGTGIDIYNMIRTQMNASFTLDGGSSSIFAYSWDSRCWGDTSSGCYNMSVYNAQSLTFGAHYLNITMLSYGGPGAGRHTDAGSDFMFDYAVISTPTSASAIPLSTSTSSSTIPSSTGYFMPSGQRSQYGFASTLWWRVTDFPQ
jgi:hypothetical protein